MTQALQDALGATAPDVQETYRSFYDWMIEEGKNPRRQIGISESTAENYIHRLDQVHRFTLTYFDPDDRSVIADEHADEILRMIDHAEITKRQGRNKGEEYGENAKRKFGNALQKYFQWRYHEGTMEYVWESKIDFSDVAGESAYRFTYRELGVLFAEAESYGSLPSYYDISEDEREKIDGLVAQRLGLPKEDVTRNDWLHADQSRHVHSLITVAYDAGLTPIEIENAETHWYNPQTKTFKIPTEHACKEREKEEVGLADDSANAMSEWLQERRHLEKYDGSNKIWLNRDGNTYGSGSLCELLRKLCEQAGIEIADRKIVWYSLRQTMGRNVTEEGELSEANDQLRHTRLGTTQENYNQTPVEKLQARLNETREKARKAAADPEYNPFEDDGDVSDSPSESSSPQPAQSPDGTTNVITPTKGGKVHVNAEIADNTEARVDITKKILDESRDT